jgi:hypothetical protein
MYSLEELEVRHRVNKNTNPSGELAKLMYQRVMEDNERLLKIAREGDKIAT